MADPNARPSSEGITAWSAAGLAVVLVVLRCERGLIGSGPRNFGEWVVFLGPELGLGLAWLGGWWLAPKRWHRPVPVLTSAAVLALVSVAGQQYFATTGTSLHRGLLVYTMQRWDELGGLVGSGIGTGLLLHLALVAVVLAGAVMLRRRQPWEPARPRRWGTAALVAGLAGYAWSLPADERWPARHALALEPFVARPHVALGAPDDPDELYQPPRVVARGDADPPNVVLIVLESTRRDLLLPWGSPERAAITPFMSSLAERAWVVDEAYVTTSHTTKALVGLVCGMYPHPAMEITEPRRLPLRCLPEILAEAGYHTAFFQSALGTFEDRRDLVRRMGFDTIATQEDLARPGYAAVGYVAMDEHVMLEPVMEYVAAQTSPFFVTVLTSVPHHPYEAPGARGPAAVEGSPAAYAAAVHHVDRFVEALFGELERSGRLRDTVVMLVGDHGEAFGEHQRQQHDAVPYDEVTTVPWLLFGPERLGAPRRVEGLRSQLDLVPTVLALAGVGWEGRLPGKSLLDATGHPRVFSSCWFDDYCASIRVGSHKIVYHYARKEAEWFDLSVDPAEESPRAVEAAATVQIDDWLRLRSTIQAVYDRADGDATEALPSEPPVRAVARPQCMRTCVADTDPASPGLQYACSVTERDPDGTSRSLPHCTAAGAVPDDAAACFFGRTDGALPRWCAERGFNLELGLRRTKPAVPGAVLDARCQLATDPRACEPRRLLETAAQSTSGSGK